MVSKRFKKDFDKFIYNNEPTPISLGTLCVMILSILLMIVATFTEFDLTRYWIHYLPDGATEFLPTKFLYVAQVPILMFIIAILGVRFSFITIFLYVLGGLFVAPYFALGGGISYIKMPVFSYVLAYFPTIIVTGLILKKIKGILGVILAPLAGVLTLHVTGFLIMLFYIIFKKIDFVHIYYLAVTLGMTKIFYDFIFSTIAVLIAKPVKMVLWVAMRNDFVLKKKDVA